jgi:ligand-binding sensor domain-containing protein
MTQLIGQTLGPYHIIEQIGVGGMATVYKAYQASVDRYVAVKVLPSQFAEDPSFLGRFEQEARTIAKLEHPHILPVHDYGEQEGITYLVMRFIEAGTLKDKMAEPGPLDLDEALRILEQVGGALGYAHSQGVIHRDIKPSNVLVDPRGDCFLTDFGIARLVEGTAQFTATGGILGTPAYMAPEQGSGEKADARSDIYALGIILYEMVTGKVPYEAETPLAVLMKHASAPLTPPRQLRPDLPESVERVILKALSKPPEDRFQRVEDMVAGLRQAVRSAPTVATEGAAPSVFDETTAIVDEAPDTELVSAPAPQRSFPLLPILAAGAVGLIALVIAAILVLPGLVSPAEEELASPPQEVEATSLPTEAAVSQTEALSAAEATPPAVAPTTLEPGWTVFISGDDVRALALQDEYIWAGGSGGLVRWNRLDGSYEWFTVADGLASNYVNDLLVDPEGILWASTWEGLSRYDPSADRWTTFDTADGLESDEVLGLYYDEEDQLLVAGIANWGFNVYDGSQWKVLDIPPIPVEDPSPRVLLEADGTLIVGLEQGGSAYFDGEAWHTSIVDPDYPEAGVNDLHLTRGGELLAAVDRGFLQFNAETESWDLIPQLDDFGAEAILEDSSGRLWFTGRGGVFRFDPDLGDWEFYQSESDELPAYAVNAVVEDEDGVLWFGLGGSGLSRFEDDEWQVWEIGQGLTGNYVESLVEDGDGNIWATLGDGYGIGRYSPNTEEWETFTEEDGALNWPSPAFVDQEGQVWIGEWATARYFDGQRWQEFQNDALGEANVWAITQDASGAMWFGNDEGTIVRYNPDDGSAQTFTARDGLPEGEVDHLHAVGDSLILAVIDYQLAVFDGTGWRHELPDYDDIYQITTAPSGEIWVAGGGRLFVYPAGTAEYRSNAWETISTPDIWIESISVGPDGIVWSGGDGLVRFDPEQRTWETIEPGDGQLAYWVQTVLAARDGAVWVGTSGGVGRYVPPP